MSIISEQSHNLTYQEILRMSLNNNEAGFFTTEYVVVGGLCPIRENESEQPSDYGLVVRVGEGDEEEKIATIVLASRGIVRCTMADIHIKSDQAEVGDDFTLHPGLMTSVFYNQIGDPIIMLTNEQLDKVDEGMALDPIRDPESSEGEFLNLLDRVQGLGSEVLDYLWDDEDDEV